MIYIAHRGNISGPKPEFENTPLYIEAALDRGFHVEVDIRCDGNRLFLGHDEASTEISVNWLLHCGSRILVHAKDVGTALRLVPCRIAVFCHESDQFTAVHGTVMEQHCVWLHNRALLTPSVAARCLIPLITQVEIKLHPSKIDCAGVCTDHVLELIRQWE